ncbi:MAG: hemerythrin domain-containing protein [Psychromonas sp.]|nr:hemerythrin domain-containing protein [Psychromonas sp.]
MLSIIHNDHTNMSRLLKILRNKIELLEQDERVDFRLIKTIITYLRTYSDKYHHPMEDLIFDYYISHYVVSEAVSTRLPEEHKTIKKATIELDELLSMILLDAIVPKEQCIKKLQSFIELQSAHIAYEEQEILPLLKDSLSAEDWLKIKLHWQRKEYDDPLFGDNISEQYRKLALILKQM